MKKLTIGLLFATAAIMSAQTTTVLSNTGLVTCGDYPYPYIQYYHVLIEGSTPPFVGPEIPPNYQIQMPNHTPGVMISCQFIVTDGTRSGTFNTSQFRFTDGQVFSCHVNSTSNWNAVSPVTMVAGQNSARIPSPYPAEHEPLALTFDCDGDSCGPGACPGSGFPGHMHIDLSAAFNWVVEPPNSRGWQYILKDWVVPAGALVITITVN